METATKQLVLHSPDGREWPIRFKPLDNETVGPYVRAKHERLRSTDTYAEGYRAETYMLRCWINDGYTVLPIAHAPVDSAPMLKNALSDLISPDFLTMRPGREAAFVEVKGKASATPYHVERNVPQHGIDLINAQHYREVTKRTGFKVCLCIIEKDTGQILIEDLAVLGTGREVPDCKYGKGGMVYWYRDQFQRISKWEFDPDPRQRPLPALARRFASVFPFGLRPSA